MSLESGKRAAFGEVALRVAMPLATALLAALAAHLGIDFAGDYLLAHDAYDDPQHGSRGLASLALVALAFGALWAVVRLALAEMRGSRGALRAELRAAVPDSPVVFAAMVTALALPMLLGMAWLDAATTGIAVDDVADLLGGSLPLGLFIACVSAFVAAPIVHRLVRLLSRYHQAIVRVVGACLRPAATCSGPAVAVAVARAHGVPRVPAALARRIRGDRAPPRIATVR